MFTIDIDNRITAVDAAPAATNVVVFTTRTELAKAADSWPIKRLVAIWNSFAGTPPFGDLKPVKKFMDRQTAVARIWSVIQKLSKVEQPKPATTSAPAPAKRKAAKTTTPAPEAATPCTAREGSKRATVVELIKQTGGATLDQIMAATGWQKHTVRGFMSTLPKKTGMVITSTRRESDKARVYAAQ